MRAGPVSALGLVLVFLIAPLRESGSAYGIPVGELEPNDTNATSNPLQWGQSGRGVIASGAEYDGWVIQSIRSGDLLFALL